MFIFIFYFHFYHRACRYGNKKATHILLDKGATPSVRNAKGITPLHMACQFNHFDIVKVLFSLISFKHPSDPMFQGPR